MPAVFVETNMDISDEKALAQALSKIVATELKKSEEYVTVSIRKSSTMTRGGTPTKFAYIEVRSIGGFELGINNNLSKKIGKLFIENGLDQSKIDINFMDIAPQNWGKTSGTFGKNTEKSK